MKKTIDLIVLAFVPLILSTLSFVAWMMSFGLFRSLFDFPWGNDKSPYPLSARELLIYNGVQVFFVILLFLASIFIYRWSLNKLTICNTAKHSAFIAITLSWLFFSFSAFNLAQFFCCPGLFPEVFNSLWWLTKPEFIVFSALGEIYLIKKCML